MKKFILPLFLLLTTVIGFTSCSKDDDKSANVSFSINGEDVANKGCYTLAKATVDPSQTGSDLITLNILSDCDIRNVQITLKNNWEDNVDVVDTKNVAYNNKQNASNTSMSKSISFVGVIGTYSVKVNTVNGTVSYTFSTKDAKDNSEYKGNSRYLSNKQTIIFDAEDKQFASKILGESFIVNTNDNLQYLNGSMSVIDESTYNDYSKDNSKSDLGELAEEKDRVWSNKRNITTTPSYYIYKSGDKYYLMKVTSIEGSILTAEIQY